MIASGGKFGFVFIERWLSNLKNIAFLRLDSKEIDFRSGIFKSGLMDLGGGFSCRGELFQNTPYFFKKMSLK